MSGPGPGGGAPPAGGAETRRGAARRALAGAGALAALPNVGRFVSRGEATEYRPDATGWYLSGEERFGFAQQLDAVLAAVANGGPPPIPVVEAVKSHQLAHGILAACEAGGGRSAPDPVSGRRPRAP